MTHDLLPVALVLVFQFSVADRLTIEREMNMALESEGMRVTAYSLRDEVPHARPITVMHRDLRPHVLGQSHQSNGEWLDMIDVDIEKLRYALPAQWLRAYARVLAHEVWHVIKQAKEHRACGIFAKQVPMRVLAAESLPSCPAKLIARAETTRPGVR